MSVTRIAARQISALLHSSSSTHLQFPSLPEAMDNISPTTSSSSSSRSLPSITSKLPSFLSIAGLHTSTAGSQSGKNAAAYTSPEGTLHTLVLPDKRNMTYRCYGPPGGSPMFYFHGTPSSAAEAMMFKDYIYDRNIFVIGTNRPGYGKSDFQPNRKLVDHAHDVLAIADSLGIEKFRVMGASGGGPFVLACAHEISKERLVGAAVVSGATPWEFGLKGMYLQGWLRFVLHRYVGSWLAPLARMADAYYAKKTPEELEEVYRKETKMLGYGLGKKDKEALENEKVIEELIITSKEAYEAGAQGGFCESQLILQDWDFKIQDIPYEGVKLYYGTEDGNTPIIPARKMCKVLKNAKMKEYEGEGHFSIFENRGGDILDDFFQED